MSRAFTYLIIILLVLILQKFEVLSLESKFNINQINSKRQEIKNYFLNAEDSPIAKTDKSKFRFNYFAPNIKYLVKANLIEFKKKDTVTILTSKENKTRRYIKFGKFEFKIDNKPFFLTCYIIPEHQSAFFVPFLDDTNGKETYEAGRYLDIEVQKNKEYFIDFNMAYSPYCAYNKKYSCPLVPKENYLKVKILAGEKLHKFENK